MIPSSKNRHIAIALLAILGASTPPVIAYERQTTPATGGETTVRQFDTNAFSLPNANLPIMKRLDFSVGNSFFRNPWVEAPASTKARDGLGPLFNTNSCQGCHIKDGRGHAPVSGNDAVSLFLRLSVPADPEQHADLLRTRGFRPAPVYGSQLQTAAIPGQKPEADLVIDWQPVTQTLADGTTVKLRKPRYRIKQPNYGPLPDNLLVSPRVAPPMTGMGLLQAIPDDAITALADPDDQDGDGISGRPNRVWDRVNGARALGRFGWKAAEPNVRQQSAGAFAGDMGLTSRLHTQTDCTPAQDCDRFAHGGQPEVSEKVLRFVTFYATSLAVPARRDMDRPAVERGATLFNQIGCAACHQPRHVTGSVTERPDLSKQTIWPYTDLLLHDMGPELADNRPVFEANGREWRTPPLWGIGLAKTVNPRAGFLHDGRARTLEEAILWHGGEARRARERYRKLEQNQRQALIRFLKSL
ncbi:thiol oxidoreductase [Tamilnaduibacter salinus]|uniref:Thiol oxidoreductase n=1 Tax=Tamilnaduibacter salinus TaxID=1484056 RepID=A0A2A2I477_9GAMM|nr:di-heme oxidoredictase family protein [Tamilnaduibacter salinus]PAV25910.1 thiol oxidoreductase [Tamilnaduibacter salinus]